VLRVVRVGTADFWDTGNLEDASAKIRGLRKEDGKKKHSYTTVTLPGNVTSVIPYEPDEFEQAIGRWIRRGQDEDFSS
jgi:hypothetical protein